MGGVEPKVNDKHQGASNLILSLKLLSLNGHNQIWQMGLSLILISTRLTCKNKRKSESGCCRTLRPSRLLIQSHVSGLCAGKKGFASLSSNGLGKNECLDSFKVTNWHNQSRSFWYYLFFRSSLDYLWIVVPTPGLRGPTGLAQTPFPLCLMGGLPPPPRTATHRHAIVSIGAIFSRRK